MSEHKYKFELYATANSIDGLCADIAEAVALIKQNTTGFAGGNGDRHCQWSLNHPPRTQPKGTPND